MVEMNGKMEGLLGAGAQECFPITSLLLLTGTKNEKEEVRDKQGGMDSGDFHRGRSSGLEP
jgi:hypothetical protein